MQTQTLTAPVPFSARTALGFTGLAMLGLALLFLLLPALDARELYGRSVWAKPLRFALSLGVLALTLAWFEHWLRRHALQVPGWRACSALLVAVLWLELGWIALQSARGEDSHFNAGSVLEGLMFSLMGLGAAWMTAVTAYLGIVAGWHWVRAHPGSAREPLLLGIALGCLLSGVLLAWTGEALVEAGVSQSAIGAAHLPLLGWRLDGSAPRPAHFLAAHLMQILPMLASGLATAGLSARHQHLLLPGVAAAGLLATVLLMP